MRCLILLVCILFAANAFASADRYLDGKYITNGAYTLTIPSITDTLVTVTGSAVLTNKTISGSNNTLSNIAASSVTGLSGTNSGDVTIGTFGSTPNANGLSLTGQAINLQPADATHPGGLTAADWSTFNGKQAALGFTAVPDTRTVNGHALSSNVTVTTTDLGLNNVTNDAQVAKAAYTGKGSILVGTAASTYTDTLTGSGNNGYILTLASGETSGVKWAAAPATAPNIIGSTSTPTLITAVGGISFTGTYYANINFIAGNAGAITVTANPQIAAATNVGQTLVLIGNHATNTVTLADGTGLLLNGSWVGGLNSVLNLVWNGTAWVETSRR